MFSSNQVFEVSCTKSQLRAVLAFALDLATDERTRPRNLVYQTTSDGLHYTPATYAAMFQFLMQSVGRM